MKFFDLIESGLADECLDDACSFLSEELVGKPCLDGGLTPEEVVDKVKENIGYIAEAAIVYSHTASAVASVASTIRLFQLAEHPAGSKVTRHYVKAFLKALHKKLVISCQDGSADPDTECCCCDEIILLAIARAYHSMNLADIAMSVDLDKQLKYETDDVL
jgi:hypothetical protein